MSGKDSEGVSMEHEDKHNPSTPNPFGAAIQRSVNNLVTIQWGFPYFPQLIESVVLIIAIAITAVLYITIGIASQIEGTFLKLMLDTRKEIKAGGLIEKSAYAVLAGVYFIFWLPFGVVLLPFKILGLVWNTLGYAGLVFIFVAVIAVVLFYTGHLSQVMLYIESIYSWFDNTTEPYR